MKKIALLLLVCSSLYAQNEQDVLRYSQTSFGGTSRIQGMGGAVSALGADITAASVNPAGLGLFRKSDISFSPAMTYANTATDYLGSTSYDNNSRLNLQTLGGAFTSLKDEEEETEKEENGFRGGSFAISFSKLNSFTNSTYYEGNNAKNSFGDFLAQQANGVEDTIYYLEGDNYYNYDYGITSLGSLGWNSYLIDYANDSTTNSYRGYVPAGANVFQQNTITTVGRQNQWDFAYGANIGNKYYVGASLGIVGARYERDITYSETDTKQEVPYFRDMTFTDHLEVSGTGVNFKLGTIIRPKDWVRFGVSIQTGTRYSFTETYYSQVTANFDSLFNTSDKESFDISTDEGKFEYVINTPAKATAGVAFLIKKYGLISADVEYLGYNTASITTASSLGGKSYFNSVNRAVKNNFTSATNIRIGAEARIKMFRLRAGFAMYGDPYKNNVDKVDRSRTFLTFGGGIRTKNFYYDIALVKSAFNSVSTPYTLQDGTHPTAYTVNKMNNLVMTFGFLF